MPPISGYRLPTIHRDGDKGYYEGKSIAEIKAFFEPGPASGSNYSQYVTPTGTILRGREAPCFYSKLTGNVADLCPDPLCEGHTFVDGERCVWFDFLSVEYCTQDHIYFESKSFEGFLGDDHYFYRCDTERNHVEFLFATKDRFGTIWLVEGERMYTTTEIYRPHAAASVEFGYVDMKTGEFHALSDGLLGSVETVAGGYVYHHDAVTGKLYRSDLQFSTTEEIFTHVNSPSVGAYSDRYLVIREKVDDWHSSNAYLYDLRSGQTYDMRALFADAGSFVFTNDYIYYLRHMTDEKIDECPYPEFYRRQGMVMVTTEDGESQCLRVGGETLEGGRLFRLHVDTMQEKLVFAMTYGGVPICPDSYMADGHLVYIRFLTYEDYNNYFNQDYPYSFGDASRRAPFRYAAVDFSNGTVRFIDTDVYNERDLYS